MGYQRRFLGGPLSGVEDRSESDEVSESVEAAEGAIYRRDEILEGGGDVIVYKLDENTWPQPEDTQ
jgi:hypothetical protein